MTIETLEERLMTMESRLDTLQRLIEERLPQSPAKEKGGWQSIVGTFVDDPLYEEAMRLVCKWREAPSAMKLTAKLAKWSYHSPQ